MSYNIIITPTNQIENAKIDKYLDLLSTNVVVGTNFFADFGAALSDIFGGYSDIYQDKLQKIYNTALKNLKQQASKIGANAIVGLKIDFDEISGKGKSMFMVSAIGMAVKVSYNTQIKNEKTNIELNYVSYNELEDSVSRYDIIASVNTGKMPYSEHWNFLMNNPINEIIPKFIDHYINLKASQLIVYEPVDELFINNISSYLKICDELLVAEALYTRLPDSSNLVKILDDINLFSPTHVLNLLENNHIKLAIKCLKLRKSIYNEDDVMIMENILIRLENLPDLGTFENVKSMLTKAKDKYKCPDGHMNDIENQFCDTFNCGKNIKGLTYDEVNQINRFKFKLEILKKELSKKI